MIKKIQKQHIKWEDSKDNSNSGDKVVLDYEGTIEGKEFENSKQKGFSFIIDDDVKGDLVNVTRSSKWSKHNRYDRFAVQTNKIPVYENVLTGPADFGDINIPRSDKVAPAIITDSAKSLISMIKK